MENESVEAIPSAENGNVPVDAPSVEPIADAPAEEKVETTEPVVPEATLYELPDGRKVDAETLSREWKENFYPDYTRKSQELAKVKTEPLTTKAAEPYTDPEWAPESYEELLKVAEERVLKTFESREQEKIAQRQAIENGVITQLESIKKSDPTLNEDALFLHATKYKFNDLNVAYENMKAMNDLAKNVQKTTANNIAKRADPVSVSHGATGARPNPSQFSTAVEYMRSLK